LTKYYGFLSGAGFSISFAISGIFWAMAAEKYNRKIIIALACIVWSLSSYFTGSVNSLLILGIMRFILGAA
jgi:MFS family permease